MSGEYFYAPVYSRWSDQDPFQHVNHARVVTLLEEARVPWLFDDGAPTNAFAHGAFITELGVKYNKQIRYADNPITVTMWVTKLGAASFRSQYELRDKHTSADEKPNVEASSTICAVDMAAQKIRRFSSEEREYLARFLHTD